MKDLPTVRSRRSPTRQYIEPTLTRISLSSLSGPSGSRETEETECLVAPVATTPEDLTSRPGIGKVGNP